MNKQQLLAEIEDILVTMPNRSTLRHQLPENFAWFGRVKAAMYSWDNIRSALFNQQVGFFLGGTSTPESFYQFMTSIHQARTELRNDSIGPLAVGFPTGNVFDYFDELRKILATATKEIFFVDPYLEAEFVAKYLPHVPAGVSVKLLTEKKLAALLPAVKAFAAQNSLSVEVRSSPQFHDRYVFIDEDRCYLSGASFKDGAKNAPTVINEITDASASMLATYQAVWGSATPQPL